MIRRPKWPLKILFILFIPLILIVAIVWKAINFINHWWSLCFDDFVK